MYLIIVMAKLQEGVLPLQGSNLYAQLRDMLLHCALIASDMSLDLLSTIGIFQCVHSVMILRRGGRYGGNHHGSGAARGQISAS